MNSLVTNLVGMWVRVRPGVEFWTSDGRGVMDRGGTAWRIVSVYLLSGYPHYTLACPNGDLIEMGSSSFLLMVGDIPFPEDCKLDS